MNPSSGRRSCEATVTRWDADAGWGAVLLDDSGMEAWTHFSAVVADGFRQLIVGQRVICDYETPGQDGYPARAVSVAPIDKR